MQHRTPAGRVQVTRKGNRCFLWFLTLSNHLDAHSAPNTTPATYTTPALLVHHPTIMLTFLLSSCWKFMHIWFLLVLNVPAAFCIECRRAPLAHSNKHLWTSAISVIYLSAHNTGGTWRTTLVLGSWYTGASILYHQAGGGIAWQQAASHSEVILLGSESNLWSCNSCLVFGAYLAKGEKKAL